MFVLRIPEEHTAIVIQYITHNSTREMKNKTVLSTAACFSVWSSTKHKYTQLVHIELAIRQITHIFDMYDRSRTANRNSHKLIY